MSIMPLWLHRLHHALSGITATPDAHTWHPNGDLLVRLNDKWFFGKDCELAPK